MLEVDEFESVFRSADKKPFRLAPPPVSKVLVISDLEGEAQARFTAAVKRYLAVLGDVEFGEMGDGDFADMQSLLDGVKRARAQMVVCHRDLKSNSWRWPYGLGALTNALIQETPEPVLLVPNPHEHPDMPWQSSDTDSVMVVADHLTGDDALVNWGVGLTREGGTLHLTHVEDDAVFERYMQAISKVPSIQTDNARETILAQLLKEPSDYIESCRSELSEQKVAVTVDKAVTVGHRVVDYRRLVEEHETDLLIFHSNDDDQVAMHGAAHSLAVELRALPLLLI